MVVDLHAFHVMPPSSVGRTEARDIVLYLKPLQKILDEIEQLEYSQVKTASCVHPFNSDNYLSTFTLHLFPLSYLQLPTYVGAVMHTVCLTWANSEHYSHPARIIVILQEICNLFIDMVIVSDVFSKCMSFQCLFNNSNQNILTP